MREGGGSATGRLQGDGGGLGKVMGFCDKGGVWMESYSPFVFISFCRMEQVCLETIMQVCFMHQYAHMIIRQSPTIV